MSCDHCFSCAHTMRTTRVTASVLEQMWLAPWTGGNLAVVRAREGLENYECGGESKKLDRERSPPEFRKCRLNRSSK